MTAYPSLRGVPLEVNVVEVYGSKFLLEWLDRDVLASAAACHLAATSAADLPTEVPGRAA